MTRRALTASEQFRGDAATPLVRLAPTGEFTIDEATRTISYIFSNAQVARDNHTIAADAWDLTNFRRNPIFLFAHDADQPPIGRVTDIGSRAGLLVGDVQYADAETYPFADTIFRLVKGRYLNAVSTSWIPRAWKISPDRARAGGMDFSAVELLEISQVPLPAVPGALATARSVGIDTGPLYRWAEKTLDTGGLLMVPRSELETLRRDAKMATTSRRLSAAADSASPKVRTRGMYAVASLASLLGSLGYIQADAQWEADMEGDDSPVPGQLLEALKSLGSILVNMTMEEIRELVGDDEPMDETDPTAYAQAAKNRRQRLLRRLVMLNSSGSRGRADRVRRSAAIQKHTDALLRQSNAPLAPTLTAADRRRRIEEHRRRLSQV
jgi:hypothetical protein